MYDSPSLRTFILCDARQTTNNAALGILELGTEYTLNLLELV